MVGYWFYDTRWLAGWCIFFRGLQSCALFEKYLGCLHFVHLVYFIGTPSVDVCMCVFLTAPCQDRPGLFHGTTFHLRGHFGKDSPPKNELEAMLLANGGTVVESISNLLARGGGSSTENRCGRRDGKSNSSSGTWRPPRVVIFQPSVDSQEGDMEALARDLAVHSMVPSSSGSEKGGRGGGAKRHGGEVEVVKALWLVDSIGSYRVLQPTIVHRVQFPNCNA